MQRVRIDGETKRVEVGLGALGAVCSVCAVSEEMLSIRIVCVCDHWAFKTKCLNRLNFIATKMADNRFRLVREISRRVLCSYIAKQCINLFLGRFLVIFFKWRPLTSGLRVFQSLKIL